MTKPLLGVRIEGSDVRPVTIPIAIDRTWERVPVAHAAGIPLYAKRMFDEHPYPESHKYVAVRFMSDPKVGLAPIDWQYGGMLGPAPPVLMARSDGKPFHDGDWVVLDDFEMLMLDNGPYNITKRDWKKCAWQEWHSAKACLRNKNHMFFDFPEQKRLNISAVSVLEQVFPRDRQCRLSGLVGRSELNGRLVLATGVYQNGRVGVVLQGEDQEKGEAMAVKPENLDLVEDKPY